jgi:hypothetical protein
LLARDRSGAEFIANAVEYAGELGISAIRGPWEASIRLRHQGPYQLIEDHSQRAPAENTVNLRAGIKYEFCAKLRGERRSVRPPMRLPHLISA